MCDIGHRVDKQVGSNIVTSLGLLAEVVDWCVAESEISKSRAALWC